VVTLPARREVACFFRESFSLSQRRSCRLANLQRSSVRYEPRRQVDPRFRHRLPELAAHYPRYGYELLTKKLRREGLLVNEKRVRRLYLLEGLKLRSKLRKKLVAAAPREKSVTPDVPNRRWSMDFMRDTLGNGRPFRTFNLIDDGSREALRIEVDFSLTAERVVRALEEIAEDRGLPEEIVMDNGPEFASKHLDAWAVHRGVKLRFIRPGRPVENCFVESFNGTFRRDCLDAHWFEDLPHARRVIESWRLDFNHDRPHSGLGDLAPAEFAALREPTAPSGPQTPRTTKN
jgi:putative transposase